MCENPGRTVFGMFLGAVRTGDMEEIDRCRGIVLLTPATKQEYEKEFRRQPPEIQREVSSFIPMFA